MALIRLIALASAPVLLLASLARAQAVEHKGFFEPQRKQYLDGVAQYPLLKQHKIDEVFRIHVEGGGLALETQLDGDHEYTQHRAEFEGMSEPAVIVCYFVSQDLGQIQFELNVDDYSDPLSFGRLHFLARPVMKDKPDAETQNIDIEKIWQTPNGFRRVFFNQTADSCRLVIFANDGGANGFLNTNLGEKDFATLRRNHPAETEKWLRPILRELHQESAFAADPSAAWQVLAADWPADEKMQSAIADKIKALDSDDFRVRWAASDALQKLGRDGALAMLKMDRSKLTLEQNLRLDEVVSRFKPLSDAEAKRLGSDASFLLDCLYGDDPIARKLALTRLTAIAGKPIDFDLNSPEPARTIAVNALRAKFFAKSAPPAAVAKHE
ncbi:MAG TPA: hypothetical protein VFE47_24325 [Tepidisphaeraceae bacterium]|jgi:hypothetical protein|nr:hypothetical protein [Tepidisphaeraceae bacterium]